jgi:hypothetical protein
VHNLVALFGSVAQDAVLANLPPVTDSLVSIQNNRFQFPLRAQIGCILANVPAGTRARINTPMYRNIALPEIYPVKITAENGVNAPIMGPMWGSLEIPMNDEFGIDVSRGGAAAADSFAGIWYAPGMTPATRGPIITMRATATLTLTVGTWVSGNLTFDQSLPNGTYEVVGMQATVADAMFARLIFPGGINYRPGVPVSEAYGDYVNPPVFRFGNFGSFGRFVSTAQPLIEVLGHTAGAEAGVYLLDLIKVS